MNLFYKFVGSPVGKLKLVASAHGLVAVLWENDDPKRVPLHDRWSAMITRSLVKAETELLEYFAGKRNRFSVRLDIRGTDFQKQAWESLLRIPFGETRTYGQLALGSQEN